MRYRHLGNSGLLVSVVGLGCNNFGRRLDVDGTRRVVDAAIDAGITLLDTADMYGESESETFLGEVLEGRRDQVVLATKFGHQGYDMGYPPAAGAKGGRAYIRRAVEASLKRLRTDYIDLYQLHTPDPAPRSPRPCGAGRPGPRGQGPLPGQLQLRRLADRRGALRRRAAERDAVRLGAEPLVAAGPRRRDRGRAGRRALRARRAAVLPAGQRAAHGEGSARGRHPGDARLARRARSGSPRSGWTRSRR